MANLNYYLTYSSSIDDIISTFETRTDNGRLKYNRLILKLGHSFGFPSLKISIIIKRTPYYKTGTGFLTFSELKKHISNCTRYFSCDMEPYKTMNVFIKDYLEYFSALNYNNSQANKKIYVFDDIYHIAARSIYDKHHQKYGDCKLYCLYGIEIQPFI